MDGSATTPGLDMPREGIEAAWTKLQDDWQDQEAHRRFISLCATCSALDEAGRRYRQVRDNDPARREEANRRLQAVMLVAMEQLKLARTPPASPPKRIMWLIVGACGIYVLYAVLTLLRVRNQ